MSLRLFLFLLPGARLPKRNLASTILGCWSYSEPRNRGSAAPRNCIKPCADAPQNVVSKSARCARCYSRRRRVRFTSGGPLIFCSFRCSANLRSQNAPSVRSWAASTLRRGNTRPYPFVPTALALCTCGGCLLYRSDCGCVQRTRVCFGRIEADTASSSCCC